MKKWELIHREGVGAFGYEIYQNTQDTTRYLVKIFVYDTPILLSGNKMILGHKLGELKQVLDNLLEMFPDDDPF